jgi:hypothetical protein
MTFSWYDIQIYLPDGTTPIFTGVFSVSTDNLMKEFYETINGITDFNQNILVTDGGLPTGLVYENFTVYKINDIQYDNAYKNLWKQFDNFGPLITRMSYYPNFEFLNFCCNNLGDELITNKGVIVSGKNDVFIDATFEINPTENPKPKTISWYNINISLQPGVETIFKGYFSVNNNENIVKSFYETINGSTNFNDNLLVTNGLPSELTYEGYTVYTKNNIQYDNAYEKNWFQFDYFGTTIKKMSYYPSYEILNLCANNLGDEVITNKGDIVTGNNDVFIEAFFNITPTIDPTCFNEGTKILCLNKNLEEEYIPIENLKKGDIVKSYKHGYRKIDLIGKNTLVNNPSKFNACMFKMEKTEENDLLEDLIVTGGHAILVDDLCEYEHENNSIFGETQKIDGKYLLLSCVSKKFKKIEDTQLYTYYHLILENNDDDEERFGIWANGILTETPSKNYYLSHMHMHI